MACLIVIGGKDFKKRFDIEADEVIIGRNPEANVIIDDRTVSRSHAKIIKTDTGEFLLRDMGSQNKTKVNDKETDEASLRDGDEIKIGATKLMFVDKEDPDVLLAKKMKRVEPREDKRPASKAKIGISIGLLFLILLIVLFTRKPTSEETELIKSIEREEGSVALTPTPKEKAGEKVQAELEMARRLTKEAEAERKKAEAERKKAEAERKKAEAERKKAEEGIIQKEKELAVAKRELDIAHKEASRLYKEGHLSKAAAKLNPLMREEFSRHPAAKLLSRIEGELKAQIRKYYDQGIIYYQMGNLDKAIENMEEALRLVPDIEHEYYQKAKEKLNTYKTQRELRR